MIFIAGLALPIMGLNEYSTQANRNWQVTQAKLLDKGKKDD